MPKATNAANIGGFWIRRVAFPNTAVTRSRRLVRAEDIKENAPPAEYVGSSSTWLRRQRMKRSPLPKWYPRTPLRDITAIYNALQRRRLREEAAQTAARANRDAESSLDGAANSVVIEESTPIQNPTCNADSSSKVQHTPFTATESETEKKLTESIDQIEKFVMKANRKKKVKESDKRRVMQRKTLMSMR